MGRDRQPKHKQASKYQRKLATRPSYDRFLIVSEGSKTEPKYICELRSFYRLHTASVQIIPSAYGTDPLSVVNYAEHLFVHGDRNKEISPRSFERVYALFDRDTHLTYHNALSKAESLNGKLKSDLSSPISFKALASVPCFELWLLLHFETVVNAINCNDALMLLKSHLPDYEKGQGGHFIATKDNIQNAINQAAGFSDLRNAYDDEGPFCAIYELVEELINLKK